MQDHIMPKLEKIMNRVLIAVIGIYGVLLIAALLVDFGTAGATSTGAATQNEAGTTAPSK